MLDLVQRIHEAGTTVVMVTHSMDDVARLCDRLIVLEHGRVAFDAARPPRCSAMATSCAPSGWTCRSASRLVGGAAGNAASDLAGGHLFATDDVRSALPKMLKGEGEARC